MNDGVHRITYYAVIGDNGYAVVSNVGNLLAALNKLNKAEATPYLNMEKAFKSAYTQYAQKCIHRYPGPYRESIAHIPPPMLDQIFLDPYYNAQEVIPYAQY